MKITLKCTVMKFGSRGNPKTKQNMWCYADRHNSVYVSNVFIISLVWGLLPIGLPLKGLNRQALQFLGRSGRH